MSDAAALSPRLTEAFDMARNVHNGASLKGSGLPYLLHVLDVCSMALRFGADEELAVAALLHDVVENGGGLPKLEEIRATFGDRVAEIVLACSDSTEEDPANKPDWWLRKILYLDHLRVATEDAAFVSGVDKLCNIRSITEDLALYGDVVFGRFRTGRVGTLWYYRRLAEVIPARLPAAPRAQHLGELLQNAVHELLAAVGAAAAADWHEAIAQEQAHRLEMSTA